MQKTTAALILVCALAGGVVHAASFPFNGSFELITAGKPMGWQVVGSWFVRPDAATDGRNGITVFGDFGQQGARLATAGYLLVSHQPLTLSFSYTSPTGGVSCGLEFCDALGNPIANGLWEELPASSLSTRYTHQFELPATVEIPAPAPEPVPEAPATVPATPATDQPAAPATEQPAAPAAPPATPATDQPAVPATEPPAAPALTVDLTVTPPAPVPTTIQVPYAGVRLVFRLDRDGARIKLDNVKLTRDIRPVALPPAPKIKAETRPNLLPNGGFALSGECDPRGWSAVSDLNHAAEQATAIPQSNFLSLQSARGKGAAWLSDPVLLDGALPYTLQSNVSAADLQECRFRTFIALVDPQDDKSVWLMAEKDVAPEQSGTVTLPLPRLWTTSGAVRARVGFEIQACGDGAVLVRNAALRPEPLSLSVRAAASSSGFRRLSDVSLFVAAVNNTYAALKPKAILQVVTAEGKLVTSETRAIVIGPRSAAYFPYKPKLTAFGSYRLNVRIMNGTMELGSTSYDFRVGTPPPSGP